MTKKAQKLISYYQGLWHAVLGTYELLIKLCKMLYNNFYLIKQMRKYYVLIGTKYDNKKIKKHNQRGHRLLR